MVRAIFIHIPKTAGVSFRDALGQGFGEDAVSPLFAASHLSDEDAENLRRYDIIAGHISIDDIHKHFPGAILLTVLREPIDRCISWYYFARRQGPSVFSDVIAAQTHCLDDFFSLDEGVTYRNIFNRQVRQLGGHALCQTTNMESVFASAQETLKRCSWIGRHESLEEDIKKLALLFPEMASVQMPRLNATGGRLAVEELDTLLLSKIERYNRYDMVLYNSLLGRPTDASKTVF